MSDLTRRIRQTLLSLPLAVFVLGGQSPVAAIAADYNLESSNAAVEVVIPIVVPIIFQYASQTGGDATLVLRITTLVTNAWFDAAAPYHESAVGVYSRLGRRPGDESITNENINTALLYASARLLEDMLPAFSSNWRSMLADTGLDPENMSTDLNTAVGIGNTAGHAVAVGRRNDGMNQTGFEDRHSIPTPYSDYTGYKPVNTAYRLRDPSRWQPDIQLKGLGLYKIQQFVTPQYANVEPYSYDSPRPLQFPHPSTATLVIARPIVNRLKKYCTLQLH